MQDIKELLQKSRLLENDVDFCQTSSRPPGNQLPSALSTSTMAIFCDQQQIDPVHSSVTSVCKFHNRFESMFVKYSLNNIVNFSVEVVDFSEGFIS